MNIKENLFQLMKNVHGKVPGDILGGSPLVKCFQMGYLVEKLELHNFVEIGIYRGTCLFSVAQAIKQVHGKAYGIDPYCSENFRENELSEEIYKIVNEAAETLDFNELYNSVLNTKIELGLDETVTIIRKTADDALMYFEKNHIKISILHIDGNHDSKFVSSDAKNYIPLVQDGGIIVFDDIDWEGVHSVYEDAKNYLSVLFECETYGILYKEKKEKNEEDLIEDLQNKILAISENIETINKSEIPTISVGVLAYNIENYIQECLMSLIKQKGNFKQDILIFEDCSTDGTVDRIREFTHNNTIPSNMSIQVFRNNKNLGLVKNYKKMIRMAECINNDFFSMVDGDDYLIDDYRMQMHIDFLNCNPDCSVSFNSILLYSQKDGMYSINPVMQQLEETKYTLYDLVRNNFMASCSVARGNVLKHIPDELFEMYTADWFLHIYFSKYGDIGFLKTPMLVYRQHANGNWSSKTPCHNARVLFEAINKFNRLTNYKYYSYLLDFQMQLYNQPYLEPFESLDLLIIDDVFPHPSNGYRLQEYTSYLEHFESMRILATGVWTGLLGSITNEEAIVEYKRAHPDLADKIIGWRGYLFNGNINCNLAYICFLGNAFPCIELLESRNIPFILELYPGGSFALNNQNSDHMLRRVMSSRCFKKVIVTQKATYDYLIQNNFCSRDSIIDIFGVVMPIDKLSKNFGKMLHYGFEKQTLDICFVAMKYTKFGVDKGYDIFIEVAKKLCKKYDNVYFHVVGGFDENVIDITEIKEHISFHSHQKLDWFDDFYLDKDIFLSPNLNGETSIGCFDGFPTAACTDAGLRETAMFCTDPLSLNNSHYIDHTDIEIIKRDSNQIVDLISYYYHNPATLKELCINGSRRIKELYSFEAQISPRIKLIDSELHALSSSFGQYDYCNSAEQGECFATKLYVNTGSGYNENDTVYGSVRKTKEYFKVVFALNYDVVVEEIRWDPLEGEYVEIRNLSTQYTDISGKSKKLAIQSSNGLQHDARYLFLTRDPNFSYRIEDHIREVHIQCDLRIIGNEEVIHTSLQYLDNKLKELNELGKWQRLKKYVPGFIKSFYHRLRK